MIADADMSVPINSDGKGNLNLIALYMCMMCSNRRGSVDTHYVPKKTLLLYTPKLWVRVCVRLRLAGVALHKTG